MPKGFAHPYLIIAVLAIIGAGVAVFAGSEKISGLVLGASSRKENIYQYKTVGLKVTMVSQDSSWDLVQYLCVTMEECQQSPTSGKWWATVSGASTTQDGHEVFIEKAAGWANYPFIKLYAKSSSGTKYKTFDSQDPYFITDTSLASPGNFVFVADENK